jgi:alkanesulfonate monooxygenase SsuD/methylene tetrahydromethanopterin reductase-like flavin-dependent oxidoreductase (luciferase family)
MLLPDVFAERNQMLTETLRAAGREPGSVRRSMMTGCVFGRDETALREKLSARKRTVVELQARGVVAGSPLEAQEQLKALEEAGVQCVMLQWLDLDDLAGLEALAKVVSL